MLLTFTQLYDLTKPYHLDKEVVALMPAGMKVHLITYRNEISGMTWSNLTDGCLVQVELEEVSQDVVPKFLPDIPRRYDRGYRGFTVVGTETRSAFKWSNWGINFVIIP